MATKKTTTKKVNTSTAPVSGSVATRALETFERRPNDENNPGTSYPTSYTLPLTGQKVDYPELQTPLKITTCSSPDKEAVHYDDVPETGFKYKTPDDFQCVYDASGQVPQFQQMNENLQDPHATMRTTKESQLIQGFHKGPQVHQYSVEENNTISSGGVVDHLSKMPTYTPDGNRIGVSK
jgi:hypothetical protein